MTYSQIASWVGYMTCCRHATAAAEKLAPDGTHYLRIVMTTMLSLRYKGPDGTHYLRIVMTTMLSLRYKGSGCHQVRTSPLLPLTLYVSVSQCDLII
jgi:hypothetical protein